MEQKLLLLYDTKVQDFARDIQDFLSSAFQITATMIPLAPNKQKTLQEKEEQNFQSHNSALFLITPGSERDGKFFPSPSVSQEMAMAKERYPESRVFYLLDNRCQLPTIDQKPFCSYNHSDAQSIVQALTRLIEDMKHAGIIGQSQKDTLPSAKATDHLATLYPDLSQTDKDFILEIGNRRERNFSYKDIETFLSAKGHSPLDIKNCYSKLNRNKLIEITMIHPVHGTLFHLTATGLEIATKHQDEKESAEAIAAIIETRKEKE